MAKFSAKLSFTRTRSKPGSSQWDHHVTHLPQFKFCASVALVSLCVWSCSRPAVSSRGVAREFSGDTCRSLSLREARTYRLPPGFTLSGTAIGDNGTILAWGDQVRVIRFDPRGQRSDIDLPGRISVAALRVDSGDTTLSLFDRRTSRVIQLDFGGKLIAASRPFPLRSGYVVRATTLGQDWGIGIVDPDSAWFQILRWHIGENPDLLATFREVDSLDRLRHYLLSGSDSTLFVIVGTRPFATKAISLTTGSIREFTPLPDSMFPAGSKAKPRKWQALAGVPLECGLLVSVSDLASDERRLAIYASSGQLQRTMGISAPLGVLQQFRDGKRLLAVRRTGSLELVVYQ